jgi:hypothetical protein
MSATKLSLPAQAQTATEARVGALARRNRAHVDILRPLLEGAGGFLDALQRELTVVRTLAAALTRMRGDRQRYTSHLAELARDEGEIEGLRRRAVDVRDQLSRSGVLAWDAAQLHAFSATEIRPILLDEQRRRIRRLRVQGHLVERKELVLREVGHLHAEALVSVVTRLNAVMDHSDGRLAHLWMWMDEQRSIWLYHHDDACKWRCVMFVIRVHRLHPHLKLLVDSYVPFGFAGDPTEYKMESSDVFRRASWRTGGALSSSWMRNNTVNLSTTETTSTGISIGRSLTDTDGTNRGRSSTASVGSSEGQTTSVSRAESWFDSWSSGYNMGGGSSASWGPGGGGSGSSSTSGFTSGRGGGQGLSVSRGTADTRSRTEGEARGESSGSSHARALGVTAGETEGTSQAVGHGFAATEGESVQVATKHYGLALGDNVADHLRQWRLRQGNEVAAHIYDDVQTSLAELHRDLQGQLQDLGNGTGAYAGGTVESRLPELFDEILMDGPGLLVRAAKEIP